VAVHGIGSLHVAVIVITEPHAHFEASIAVQEFPVITALALLPATLGPQSTCTVIELLLELATVPPTVICVGLDPLPSGVATMEFGLIEIVHIVECPADKLTLQLVNSP
jgi:hypothetical protein